MGAHEKIKITSKWFYFCSLCLPSYNDGKTLSFHDSLFYCVGGNKANSLRDEQRVIPKYLLLFSPEWWVQIPRHKGCGVCVCVSRVWHVRCQRHLVSLQSREEKGCRLRAVKAVSCTDSFALSILALIRNTLPTLILRGYAVSSLQASTCTPFPTLMLFVSAWRFAASEATLPYFNFRCWVGYREGFC